MSVIEEAVYTHLKTDANVAALVGTRIYPLVAPQDAAYPLLVYQRISTPRVRSHSGPSGLAYPRIQITCAADQYDVTRSLANTVRASMDGFKGLLGSLVDVGAVFAENEIDEYEDQSKAFTIRLDMVIWHKET